MLRRGPVQRFGSALGLIVGCALPALAGAARPALGASRHELAAPTLVLERLEAQRDRLTAVLGSAHETLSARAGAEAPRLLERLQAKRPTPRLRGWGVLPELRPDAAMGAVELRLRRYSLRSLEARFDASLADARGLLAKASLPPPEQAPLEPLVTRFQALRSRLGELESHLSYHAYWQQAVLDWPEWFARRDALAERARELERCLEEGADDEQLRSLREGLLEELAPFEPPSSLALVAEPGGGRRLTVELLTDIEDEAFLDVFRRAVEEAFNQAPAAREASLKVELRLLHWRSPGFDPIASAAAGRSFDLRGHLARFPADALVLTTGADSTHSFVGRAVMLGPDPLTPRTLAHEFAHLLGFSDAYLRACEGDPGGPYGVVLLEWSGLADDLMGSPTRGAVSPSMVRLLLGLDG